MKYVNEQLFSRQCVDVDVDDKEIDNNSILAADVVVVVVVDDDDDDAYDDDVVRGRNRAAL